MQIPTQITVGKTSYVVRLTDVGQRRYGDINYQSCVIRIGAAYPPKRQALTFWHEATHAILHDMRHPLTRDEAFVDAFSKRLDRLIKTARFA